MFKPKRFLVCPFQWRKTRFGSVNFSKMKIIAPIKISMFEELNCICLEKYLSIERFNYCKISEAKNKHAIIQLKFHDIERNLFNKMIKKRMNMMNKTMCFPFCMNIWLVYWKTIFQEKRSHHSPAPAHMWATHHTCIIHLYLLTYE